MNKKRSIFAAIILVLLVLVLFYNSLDRALAGFLKDTETIKVSRVIDGDTVVLADGSHIRMLGMNAPETTSKEKWAEDAKVFLTNLVNNKTVRVESEGKDLYGRTLAWLFLGNENVNQAVVEAGYANPYFPQGTGTYKTQVMQSWNDCLKKDINFCTASTDVCVNCIILKKLDVSTQEAEFYNQCNFACNITHWQIKDEGRKEFYFPEYILYGYNSVKVKVGNKTDTQNILYWPGYSYVWTKAEDTLFLRDRNIDLVLWDNYVG